MNNKHSIFVCQSCAGVWKDGRQVGNSGGYQLLLELHEHVQDWSLAEEFEVRGVSCMGNALVSISSNLMGQCLGPIDRNA
jgi:predicted metal-binding protein